MKKIIICLLVIVNSQMLSAQNVGIGTATPNTSAQLDVASTTKGLLIPRMTTTERTAITPLPKGLMVFDSTSSSFWFYEGAAWREIPAANKVWKLGGNAGTNAAVNFIGTTDDEPLVFKVNNNRAGFINNQGNTALGYQTFTNNTTGFSNSGFGNKTLALNTTGIQNVAVGYLAFSENISGDNNTAVGVSALRDNFDGNDNVALGMLALAKNDYGNANVAIGFQALFNNTAGSDLVAVGYKALYNNSLNGFQNTAVGSSALYSNTTGDNNTAIGFASLLSNVNGVWNTATGDSSLSDNTSGQNNNAFGSHSLKNNLTGGYNCAFGYKALYASSSGFYNTSIGDRTMTANTNGGYNVAVGGGALDFNTTGDFNTAIGYNSNVQATGLSNATAIGYNTLVNTSNTMRFGNSTVTKWGFGRNVSSGVLQVGDDATNGNGAYLSAGGTWTNTSDANKKENFSDINGKELLQKIMQLPITKWNYKGQASSAHIGPTAQDFYKLFGVGDDDKSISSIDPSGIALRAIQELIVENKKLQMEMKEMQHKIEILMSKKN